MKKGKVPRGFSDNDVMGIQLTSWTFDHQPQFDSGDVENSCFLGLRGLIPL